MSNALTFEVRDRTAVIRFTRPETRNALSVAVLEELYRAVDELEQDHSLTEVYFTGSDEVFASGADIREIARLKPETAPEFATRGQRLMDKIADLKPTTIAAINGYCYGGALDLALACDQRIATRNATFCHPGVGLGIITGWGGTQRLPRLVGAANASMMFFAATPIKAAEALRIGLIDKIEVELPI
jgi:enoyl-CoA hydratase/carnithine racemase